MTLVEIMVTLVVLLIVIGGAGAAYLKLLKGFKSESKIAESYMGNLTARELLRYDIEMAGFGLPSNLNGITYYEAVSDENVTPNPTSFNEPSNTVPRPLVFGNNGATNNNSSDVLVIKSTVANLNKATRKWSTLYYDGIKWKVKRWQVSDQDFSNPDRVIVMDTSRKLLLKSGSWYFTFKSDYYSDASELATPTSTGELGLVHGINSDSDLTKNPRMPFNRVDYYLKRPVDNFPSRCYPESYILYRSTINHGDGKRNDEPLMDCVMDFQVIFGLADNTWTNSLASLSANDIRQQVRQVNIAILYHEGKQEDSFYFPGSLSLEDDPAKATVKTFTPSNLGEAVHYRWEVLKMAIKPMNLTD